MKLLACVRMDIQLTSAVNKRGFARLKLIRYDLRARLCDDLLDWFVLIMIEGPDVCDDHDAVRAKAVRARNMIERHQLKQRVPSRGNLMRRARAAKRRPTQNRSSHHETALP